ncbi:MAG: PadR family transcriptional regulator [Pseudomonadota bacterium]
MDVKTLCLGILALGEATGYEIKKLVADGAFSFFSEASFGSIYPALTKLMQEGCVTCRSESQDGRPDKKIYALTEKGEAELKASLLRSPGPDKQRSEFLATVLFSEAVSPDRLAQLIAERRHYHEERIKTLEAMQGDDMSPAGHFVIGYGLHVQRAALDFLKREGAALLESA